MRLRVFVWKNAFVQENEGVFWGLCERVSASLSACMCERVSVCVSCRVFLSATFLSNILERSFLVKA